MVRTGKGPVVTSEHGLRLLFLVAACGTMEKAIGPGAQTSRPGDAWPVSASFDHVGSPAAFVLSARPLGVRRFHFAAPRGRSVSPARP